MRKIPTYFKQLASAGVSTEDATALRRISMTLRRWYEMECGTDQGAIERDQKWAIERAAWPRADKMRWWDGAKWAGATERRTYSDKERANYANATGNLPIDAAWRDTGSKPYLTRENDNGPRSRWLIADRETGACKRLVKIMARYPSLRIYLQTDPRGCALYIIRPGDVPDGVAVDTCYSRGVAVFK